MKILVLGSNGQVGKCIYDVFKNSKEHELVFTTRNEIDISNFDDVKLKIVNICPDVIVNSAAYTKVDDAETFQDEAKLINYYAVKNLAQISHDLDIWLIHLSTDYVFNGNSKIPYKENALTNPLSFYGKTKLLGEEAIKDSHCKYLIIRTSWVFSEHGNNFLKTMLRLSLSQSRIGVIIDELGCPTYAGDIAVSIKKIINRISFGFNSSEILNYCGNKSCSWYEFASVIFEKAVRMSIVKKIDLKKIYKKDYLQKADRPDYSELDCSKIYNLFGIKRSDWEKGIDSSLINLNKNSI